MRGIEKRFDTPIDQILHHYYTDKGYTLKEMGELLEVDPSTVWMWMFKFGIKRRRWMLPSDEDR